MKLNWGARTVAKIGAATGATSTPALVREATKAWMPFGQHIVIIGGDLVGLELAEFLAHRGRDVTVIDEAPKFGRGLQIVRRWRVLDELRLAGVRLEPALHDIAIQGHVVTAKQADAEPISWTADQIIVAKGAGADIRFLETLRAAGFAPHGIGDAGGVGFIEGAMRSAAELAATL